MIIQKSSKKGRSINDDEPDAKSKEAEDESFPIFGHRPASRRGCKLTLCLTALVVCAAALVVVLSVMIAHHEQIQAQLLLDIGSVAADFAFWDPYKQVLYWVDRQENQIHMYDPVGNTTVQMQFDHTIGVVVPRLLYNDSVIITSKNYVATYNLTTGEEDILTLVGNVTANITSFTDGRCDPSGALWMGSSEGDLQPTGTLYKVDPIIESALPMLHNISTPGGMAWSKDKKTFFFIDSKNSRVNAYSYSIEQGIVYQRVAFTVPVNYGVLSGLAIDSTDSLWVAIIGPSGANGYGRVCRYDAYLGQLQETLIIPVSEVTSCVFGGPNMDQLYITTRQKSGESHSGGIYVANRLGAIGATPYLYSG